MDLYHSFLRPLLFCLPAEAAHNLALMGLRTTPRLVLKGAFGPVPQDPVRLFGLNFPNRVGLGAGMDKNASALGAWEAMGFGFIEAGTITALAQPGNPKPRCFRFPAQSALINRMFEHLCVRFPAEPRNVQTQLILGICTLVIESNSWPAAGAVESTMSVLSPHPVLLLRTLELFGEESGNAVASKRSLFANASFPVMQKLLSFYDAARPAPASDLEKQLAFKCIC